MPSIKNYPKVDLENGLSILATSDTGRTVRLNSDSILKVRTDTEVLKDAAQSAAANAENSAVSADSRATDANDAMLASEAARDAAVVAKNAAEIAEDNALLYATAANQSKIDAGIYRDTTLGYKNDTLAAKDAAEIASSNATSVLANSMQHNTALIPKSSSDTWASIFALPYDNFRLKFSSYHASVPAEISANPTTTEYEVQRVGRNGLIFISGANKWAFTSDGGARKDASIAELIAYCQSSNVFNSTFSGFVENSTVRSAIKSIQITNAVKGYLYLITYLGKSITTYNEQFIFYRKEIATGTETIFGWNTIISDKTGVKQVSLSGASASVGASVAPDVVLVIDWEALTAGTITPNTARMIVDPINYRLKDVDDAIAANISTPLYADNLGIKYDISSNKQNNLIQDFRTIINSLNSVSNGGIYQAPATIKIPAGSNGRNSYVGVQLIPIAEVSKLVASIGKKLRVRMLVQFTSKIDGLITVNGQLHNSGTGTNYTAYSNQQYKWISDTLLECTMDTTNVIATNDDWTIGYMTISNTAPTQASDFYVTITEASWYYAVHNNYEQLLQKLAQYQLLLSNIPDLLITNPKLALNSIFGDVVKDAGIGVKKFADVIIGKNKFNQSDSSIISGKYFNSTGGQVTFGTWKITHYIPVVAGQAITCNSAANNASVYHELSDTNKVKTSMVQSSLGSTVTALVDGYVRFTLSEASVLASVQVELGSVSTSYEAYQVGLPSTLIVENTTAESPIYLPSIIPVAKGVELNIYTDGLRKISDEKELDSRIYIWSPTAQRGYMKSRRFQYAFNQAETGDFAINAIQKTPKGGAFGYQVSSTVKRVGYGGSGTLNVLAIGDSITERGISYRELQNLFYTASHSPNSGADIRFFGTRANGATGANNPHSFGTIYTESRGGWWTNNFLSAARTQGDSMDAANPFWNAGRSGGADADFAWYVAQLNAGTYSGSPISGIDVFMITLGTNDIGIAGNTTTQYIANLNSLITKMWRDYPNCKIVICGVPPRGINASTKNQIIDYNAALNTEFATPRTNGVSGKCVFAPVSFWMDREAYGIDGISRIPGSISIVPENSNYGDLHPYLIPSYQLADAQFSGIQYALNL